MIDKEQEFETYLIERKIDPETQYKYKQAVRKAIIFFREMGLSLEEASVNDFEKYIYYLIDSAENNEENIVGLARYMNMIDNKEAWIYFALLIGGREILPSIADRLESIAGKKLKKDVFKNVKIPPLGSKPAQYCEATSNLMKEFKKKLSPDVYRRVLAGNHHKVPEEWFMKHKQWLRDLNGDIDAWLEKMHNDAIEDLENHLKENKVWFEQVITQGIVDYVKNNQELLSGVRKEEWIYNTKFPYAPQKYLDEKKLSKKRYYMCHCPLAREAVLNGQPNIPGDWCYCSAGYGKLRYDIAFEEETKVEVLESVLDGSDKCRFRIQIPEKWR
jgi:hypothetical protein